MNEFTEGRFAVAVSQPANRDLVGHADVDPVVLSDDFGFDGLAIDVELDFRKPAILLGHRHRDMASFTVVEFLAFGNQAHIVR